MAPSIRAAHNNRGDYNEVSAELRVLTLILLNILALPCINDVKALVISNKVVKALAYQPQIALARRSPSNTVCRYCANPLPLWDLFHHEKNAY